MHIKLDNYVRDWLNFEANCRISPELYHWTTACDIYNTCFKPSHDTPWIASLTCYARVKSPKAVYDCSRRRTNELYTSRPGEHHGPARQQSKGPCSGAREELVVIQFTTTRKHPRGAPPFVDITTDISAGRALAGEGKKGFQGSQEIDLAHARNDSCPRC